MKRFFLSVVLATTLALTSCQFDDSALWSKLDEYGQSIKDHEQRISALEELCKQMNTNIEALQTLVDALEKRDYVTNVSEVRSNGEVIGYTISFAYSDTITIYHGKDGQDGANGADGKDGYTPQIGVMKDTDSIYYWTLDGEWLLDAKGNKIKAVGTDGADGKDGQDGINGTDGKDGQDGTDGKDGADGQNGKDGADGVTPQLKIENDYWYVSYDNGATWVQLGKATGEDGKDGQDGNDGTDGSDGADGDSFFQSVTQDEECVYLTLADGTIITLPKYKEPVEKVNNKIYYTTTDGKKMFPASTSPNLFGAILISNTYEDGQGVLTFDDTVTAIGHGAFSDCTRLATITLEGGVEVIGNQAFDSCTSLTSIIIPDGVSSIGEYAFVCCKSLTSVTIPDSVKSIGPQCFGDCASLEKITIPKSVTSIYRNMFDRCISLREVVINNEVTYIGQHAFYGCTSLTNIKIPDSVTKIDNCAFWDCTALCNVIIPDSVIEIGEGAFMYCTALANVIIGNGVVSIGQRTFSGCSSLTSITISDSVTSIGDFAFLDCTSLTAFYGKYATSDNRCWVVDGALTLFAPAGLGNYTIPDNVISIGERVFQNTSSLKKITIGNSVTSIGQHAFLNSSLTSVTISDSVTSIGKRAFSGCTSLIDVAIGSKVSSIGAETFYGCTSLKEIYCKSITPPTGGSNMFSYYHNNSGYRPIGCKIYVPTASVDTYKATEIWSNYADYIEGYEF